MLLINIMCFCCKCTTLIFAFSAICVLHCKFHMQVVVIDILLININLNTTFLLGVDQKFFVLNEMVYCY